MTQLQFNHAAVISDLHVGDPRSAGLEDFDSDDEFERLLTHEIPTRIGWPATLVIAGDFIDFPQVMPELARHPYGDYYGTTEAESLKRLERVIEGHPRVFSALDSYIARGGHVRLLPGNHDVDYHWPAVEARLRAAIGGHVAPGFVFVREGSISERGVYIEHGNQYAFENSFLHWERPILDAPDGARLERPWGTLFMDLVYNDVEAAYPFINQVYPISALAMAALRSFPDKVKIRLAARVLAFLITKGKRFVLERLLGEETGAGNDLDVQETVDRVLPDLDASVREDLIREVTPLVDEKTTVTEELKVPTSTGLLGRDDERGLSQRANELLLSGEASIVVFGHTHVILDGLAPFGVADKRRVFNAGSWMPRIAVEQFLKPTFNDFLRSGLSLRDLRFLALDLGDPPRARLESL